MNTITQVITLDWVNAIGWTLLHSLWQALIVLLVVAGVLRLMPSMRSNIRYAIACAGLVVVAAISAATLLKLVAVPADPGVTATVPLMYEAVYFPETTAERALLPSIVALIGQHMQFIVVLWAIGFSGFVARWAMGLHHSYRIRRDAQLIEGEWFDYVQRTATALSIHRGVKVAESARISAPVVLGYLKPLILVPVGMIAGLSTQQLETIFLHELAHIRRSDYLVNLLQTMIESIFFFNPFVRMLSNEIRREREYCCDDVVVNMHGNSAAYAHALVRLAESRVAAPAFALSLTGHKNQLLARIKRIMERSAKNTPVRSRLLIFVLIFAGALASISWISADREDESSGSALLSTDTLPDDRNTARFSRKRIITVDENGQPHEEIIQKFEGDEELRAMLQRNMAIFDDSAFANGFHGFHPGQFDRGMMMPSWTDTIPPFDKKDWQEFADAFDERFRERFENLFHGDGDPRKLMEEFEQHFQWEDWTTPFDQLPLDSLDRFREGDVFKNFRDDFEKFREFAPEGLEELKNLRSFNNPVQNYERALREQLVEDGYLSPEETIESLQWSDDSFKVNGKSLKPGDVKRYNDLRKGILEGDGSKIE